jgi:hypothetical protein
MVIGVDRIAPDMATTVMAVVGVDAADMATTDDGVVLPLHLLCGYIYHGFRTSFPAIPHVRFLRAMDPDV